MKDSLKKEAFNGALWSAIERFGVQGVQFLVVLVMARKLTPEDYGIVGMLVVFVSFAQAFVDSGFTQALVRKKDRTDTDNATVFYFNIAISTIIYILLFFCAPFVSEFYDMPSLTPFMRVICLSVIVNAFGVVQRALYTASLDFKSQAKAALIAALFSGVIGISLAYLNFGPWALVYQQLSNLVVNTFLLWIYSAWRPLVVYSWRSFHELFSFGSKLLATSMLNSVYNNIHTIVIGKLYSASSLGLYSRAKHFANLPSGNLTSVFLRVTFPLLCKVQDDREKLEDVYRRLLRTSAYVVFPLLVGMAAIAKPMIIVLLGNQWKECASLLQIICFAVMWYPIHAINLDILQVNGRSDLFLKLEVWKKILSLSLLCATAPFGIYAMCYGNIVASLIGLYINTYYSSILLNIPLIAQIKDLVHIIVLCAFMFVSILLLNELLSNYYVQFVVDVIWGISFYVGISHLLKFKEYKEVKNILLRK